jgi:hypothetical protein
VSPCPMQFAIDHDDASGRHDGRASLARGRTAGSSSGHDYPTATRADYVIGCLAANGFKREMLSHCACGIDTIADPMPYDDCEKARTIMSMQQVASANAVRCSAIPRSPKRSCRSFVSPRRR